MSFTHKLSKRLAIIKPALLLAIPLAFGACMRDSTETSIPQITQLVIVPDSVQLGTNQTYQLVAYGRTTAGDSVTPAAQALNWSSDDDAVATVSSSGVVTSHAEGAVTITATSQSNGKQAHGRVRVKPGTPPPPPPPPTDHAGWHVAADGSSSGSGTTSSPWSMTYALSGAGGKIQPGDTVWVHGGIYHGKFSASVAGAPGKPVVIRQYPGERAMIDIDAPASGSTRADGFIVRGQWTEWWDFEVMTSSTVRDTDLRPNMIINSASNTQYIDLIVHDGGIGFYTYASTSNVEVNGSIFYNNGWQRAKGGGHAMYLKSDVGPLLVRDNVAFDQYGYGIHVYSNAGDGQLNNITLDGNASFNNSSVTLQYATGANANIIMGGEEAVRGGKVMNNMTYFSPGYGVYNVMVGFDTHPGVDVTLANNYFVGGQYVMTTGYWDRVTATGNQFFGPSRMVQVKDVALSGYTWSGNTYARDPSASGWRYNGTDYSFSSWKANTGLGSGDVATASTPSAPQVFVRPSTHEPGRAMVVVYNWSHGPSVSVNLAGVLTVGQRYEVRNVQDWFGTPVTTGTYGGGSITLPMDGVAPPTPIGWMPHQPPRTGPEFDVFVVKPVQ